ncbi:MAG TPA: hypothetical protein DCE42_01795 [Myxococcales bacterium]|nr:hypothetical protein [Deltaproteobacteria bacterium]MBU51693.1 hypothetical protein [Deltaproteobacteria bacterium]HAA53456.1 hypothetical protein [Myxococcales bacterium]
MQKGILSRMCLLLCVCVVLSAASLACNVTLLPCEARLQNAQNKINANQAGLNECEEDADCVVVPSATDCQGTCPVPLAKDEAKSFKLVVDDVNYRFCQGYKDSCPYMAAKCQVREVVCKSFKCVFKD